jgi:amino acid adenylation domain-containing protein
MLVNPNYANTARGRILEMFRDVVRRVGDETALVASERRLTYAELNCASDHLCAQLVQSGIGQGALVAVMTERTVHAAIAYMAILKAGAAFMPIGLDIPFHRNHAVICHTRVGVLLTTHGALAASGSEKEYRSVLRLIDIETLEGSGCDTTIAADSVPDLTAYVIQTSGSMGVPKAAANTCGGLLNLVEGLVTQIYPEGGSKRNIALLAPFTFDPSIQQLFAAILNGHCLYVCPEHARFDGGALFSFLNKAKIDISDGTPTHLRLLANAPCSLGNRLHCNLLLIGGEALSVETLSAFTRRFGDAQAPAIVNLYGTAECAVDSTFYLVDRSEVERLGFVPIGRPFRNVQVQVLNPDGRELEEGELGELTISGAGVGVGYLSAVDAYRQCFLEMPSGQRIYRTGDLGSKHAGGLLQCRGRQDRQIKVHGVRIEPAEIEAAIQDYVSHEAISAKVVSCEICLLDTRHPNVTVSGGICSVCAQFEVVRDKATQYFGAEEDFVRVMRQARLGARDKADCLLLYSGGKDSTYVLLRLIELGYRVATFTFDNGYISRTALENIDRTTKRYGIRHVTATLAQMKTVFAESLRYESTVCGGCFRALTLLSADLARKQGINVVITGLSRGQIFDTKLRRLFEQGIFDPAEIDSRLETHRKIFDVREDPVSRSVGLNDSGSLVDERLHHVDFFRYDSASSSDVRQFLIARDERWRAPQDTGFCSTNCRANDVGIYVHRMEKGYHNYAAPLSWDIRLRVTQRKDVARELDEPLQTDNIKSILTELAYTPRDRSNGLIQEAVVVMRGANGRLPMLCGYFVSSRHINVADLRDHLSKRLPDAMMPRHLIRVDALPLTQSGKVDISRLPLPTSSAELPTSPVNGSGLEIRVRQIWREVLGVESIEVSDNFFDLGGDSLLATIMVSMIESQLGRKTSVVDMFRQPTLQGMVELLGSVPFPDEAS